MITNDFKVGAISIESRYVYNFYIIPIQDSESDSVPEFFRIRSRIRILTLRIRIRIRIEIFRLRTPLL